MENKVFEKNEKLIKLIEENNLLMKMKILKKM